jgi:hypothetical protein
MKSGSDDWSNYPASDPPSTRPVIVDRETGLSGSGVQRRYIGPDGWAISMAPSPTKADPEYMRPIPFSQQVPQGIKSTSSDQPTQDEHHKEKNTPMFYNLKYPAPTTEGSHPALIDSEVRIDDDGNVYLTNERSYRGTYQYGGMRVNTELTTQGVSLLNEYSFEHKEAAERKGEEIDLAGAWSLDLEDGKTVWFPGSQSSFSFWYQNKVESIKSMGSEVISTPTTTTEDTTSTSGTEGTAAGTENTTGDDGGGNISIPSY